MEYIYIYMKWNSSNLIVITSQNQLNSPSVWLKIHHLPRCWLYGYLLWLRNKLFSKVNSRFNLSETLMKSPILGQKCHLVLPDFQRYSNVDWLVNTTLKILQSTQIPKIENKLLFATYYKWNKADMIQCNEEN